MIFILPQRHREHKALDVCVVIKTQSSMLHLGERETNSLDKL